MSTLEGSYHSSIYDISKQNERIRHRAYFDQLTGLPNKISFLNNDDSILEKSSCVGLFSIVGHDSIHSIYGIETIEEILVAVSQELIAKRPNMHAIARTESNEFAFILKKS